MPLTDIAIRKARPGAKNTKLSDGKGLYLLLTARGGKWWRFDYRIDGKRKTLSMGTYPEVSLKLARERRDESRAMVARGVDPAQTRKAHKCALEEVAANSFESIAMEWYTKFCKDLAPTSLERVDRCLQSDLLPWVGKLPVKDVTAPVLLEVVRRVEQRGAIETAHRTLQTAGRIFRYAIATGRAERDPSQDLRGALPPKKTKHHATIVNPDGIAGLLRAIDTYEGHFVTRCALRLAPLVFARPGELRHAEWSEVDLGREEWRIPAEKMKMRDPHVVPLSRQSLHIIRELQPLTGGGRYLFPSVRTEKRPMSENTVTGALRRLGYATGEMTGHGFRSMASTVLHEQGWPSDIIERQLAHAERNTIKAAYNFAQHLPERRKMMQAWADYLDGLRNAANLVQNHRSS